MLDSLLNARPGANFRIPTGVDEEDMPDKGVNFPMFLTMMGERLFEFDTEPELLEAFECFDDNDTGTVKVAEVRKFLSEMGDKMSEEEVCATRGKKTFTKGNVIDRPALERVIHRPTREFQIPRVDQSRSRK